MILKARRPKNINVGDLETSHGDDLTCLNAKNENTELWNQRLGHVSSYLLNKLVSRDLVCFLLKLKFSNYKVCDACVKGKKPRLLFKLKKPKLRAFGCKCFGLNSGKDDL